ncbi:helix-turn-helix domain-containing protein [Haloarchaeobius amylolyticus]|uniref:Helix-turn-helix domain-containing protein n=1 Tax=Haloarchaeobius amylolyticus TaxID=1198296 RepID=A0ABD6BDK5_9EURY
MIQSFDGATLAELVDHFDLAKRSVQPHLTTLRHHGYVVKEGKQYHIGLKFYNRGEYARSRKQAYHLAAEAVRDIADTTNEEVDFLDANDGKALTVYELEAQLVTTALESVDRWVRFYRTILYRIDSNSQSSPLRRSFRMRKKRSLMRLTTISKHCS